MQKILLTLADDMIAPRFDLATEVLIVALEDNQVAGPPRSMLLPGPSADDLCGLILKEDIALVVCGGIEEEHYQFLSWKKVKVIDRVIGESKEIVKRVLAQELQSGDIVKGFGPGKGGGKT